MVVSDIAWKQFKTKHKSFTCIGMYYVRDNLRKSFKKMKEDLLAKILV